MAPVTKHLLDVTVPLLEEVQQQSLPGASPVPRLVGLHAPDGRSSDLSGPLSAAAAAAGAGLPHLSPSSPRGASPACAQHNGTSVDRMLLCISTLSLHITCCPSDTDLTQTAIATGYACHLCSD